MSQPPPPPGNPPPPPGGYGYPAPAPGPEGDNPYAAPVPPGQNPYAAAPTQPAFPQAAFPQAPPPPPPPPPSQQPGVPQGPPPPPGYGYPGQQQQPVYGQQLPGYNQQQPNYGQPQFAQTPPPGGYAYPGQTPPPGAYAYPGQTPPAARGGNKMVVIIAAVVAAVLVIGGGVYFATKGGGDDKHQSQGSSGGTGGTGGKSGGSTGGTNATGHNTSLALKWQAAADTVAEKDNLKDALGIWFTDKYVVKNEIDKVVGYDAASGSVAWTIPAPGRGDCTAARDSYQNRTAIQFGAHCEKIMAIDLAAGTPLWTVTLPGGTGKQTDFDYSEMAVSGDTVGVDWLDGSIAYRISDKKVLWQSGNGNCEDDGYAGGKQFVAVVNCDYETYKVQVVDPAKNGASKWTWTAPSGTKVNAIVSTDPVVVLLGTDGQTYTDVVTLADGHMQSRVSLGARDKYDISDDGTEKQAVHNVLVDKDTLYLSLDPHPDSNGKVLGGVVAFNLGDGKQKWIARPDARHGLEGLDFQDGKLLAYEPADYDVQGKLVLVDPASGAVTPYADFPSDAYDQLDSSALHSYYAWHNGQFYVVTKTVYSGQDNQKYVVVFG